MWQLYLSPASRILEDWPSLVYGTALLRRRGSMAHRRFKSRIFRVVNDSYISASPVVPGVWIHYSGAKFEVIGTAAGANHDDRDKLVIYRGLRSGTLYYRTIADFLGTEDVDGCSVPRFSRLSNSV